MAEKETYSSGSTGTSRSSGSKEDFCQMLKDPQLWSEGVIDKALKQSGSTNLDKKHAQSFIREYLNVVCGEMSRGGSI